LIGGGGIALVASAIGYKSYGLLKKPDLESLDGLRDLITELAETIIPQTDTPGAKAAGAGSFIIKMVRDCTPVQSQNNFLTGLNDVESYTSDAFGRSFIQCSQNERDQTLKHFEEAGAPLPGIIGKVEKKIAGESFFILLKRYTVLGYCTSEIGATQGLAYDYIPGRYVANIPLGPRQKAWATQ
jgi:hypothetical protein